MESRKERDGWMSVPQFGEWDQKKKGMDYSMIFSRARANRKQNKVEVEQPKIANKEELVSREEHEGCISKRKRFLRYLSSCIKA